MFIGSSYGNETEFIDTVGDKVQVIHLIGPEPHPLWPYTNFDSGNILIDLFTHPLTYSLCREYENEFMVDDKPTPIIRGKTPRVRDSSIAITSRGRYFID